MIWNLTKTEKDKAQLTIYGPIRDFSSFFGGGVSPQKVMQDLDELANVKELTVRINSGGGSAFAGFAIYEILKAHGARITVHIDGVAASAASIIAMAGDKIIMGTGAMMMVHHPWTRTEGDANEHRKTVDLLDKVSESLINIYEVRTGKTREELKVMLDETMWMTADEAVAKGFADEVDRKTKVAASIQGDFVVFNGEKFALNYFPVPPQLPVEASIPVQQETMERQGARTDPNNSEKDGDTVKDLEELKAKYPELYQAAINAGIMQERARFKALQDLEAPGCEEILNKARFETGAKAEEVAIEIVNILKTAKSNPLNAAIQDAAPLSDVKPADSPMNADQEQRKSVAEKMANAANKKRGVN
jgi:ATP-dependent protease ClpP protease subunit